MGGADSEGLGVAATETTAWQIGATLQGRVGSRLAGLALISLLAAGCAGQGGLRGTPLPDGAQPSPQVSVESNLPTIAPSQVESLDLFRVFWESTNRSDGLSHHGEHAVSVNGVRFLFEHARTHRMDGTPRPASEPGPDATQRAAMKAILEHPRFGIYFDQNARPLAYDLFGLPREQVQIDSGSGAGGSSQSGSIRLPAQVSVNGAGDLNNTLIQNLAAKFASEYSSRRAFFEDPTASPNEKGLRVLGLFRDYTSALWSHDQLPLTEVSGRALLREFTSLPFAAVHGNRDFNDLGWSAAQSLVLNIDPFKFPTSFPKARSDAPIFPFSMYGSEKQVKAMEYLDKILQGMGRATGAAEQEMAPVLGYMAGQQRGNRKCSLFEEVKPFSTSCGVNFLRLVFPDDPEVARLEPKPDFEFPIDAVTQSGRAVEHQPGNRIEVQDRSGNRLRAEKVVHNDARGAPKHVSARFYNAQGQEVPPSAVVGLIKTSSGSVAGNGRVDQNLNNGYWGFCNVTSGGIVTKVRYALREFDADPVRVRAGDRIVEVPREYAQLLLDMDLEQMGRITNVGFRFNNDPVTITMGNGQTYVGNMEGFDLMPTANTERVSEDRITVSNADGRAFPERIVVRLRDGTSVNLQGSQIRSISGETMRDLPLSLYLGFIARLDGVWVAEGATGASISNGARRINKIEVVKGTGDERPSWFRGELTNGSKGPLVRQPGDAMRYYRAVYGHGGDGGGGSTDSDGWAQVDQKTGVILNEGFGYGQPDFGWSPSGPLNWSARSNFTKFMAGEIRLALLVNGISDERVLAENAALWNLPSDWRNYRVR